MSGTSARQRTLARILGPHFVDQGGLRIEQVRAEGLLARYGSPLYVYSAATLRERYRALASALVKHSGLSTQELKISYAMKSCSTLAILRLLRELGAGADLVSGGELFRARRAGFAGRTLVFSGVGKTRQEILEALDARIDAFHVESLAELGAIARAASERGTVARVALRFNPDVDARSHPYISTGLKRDKFGLDARDVREVMRVLARDGSGAGGNAAGTKRALELVGLSIHIGSQMLSLEPITQAAQRLADLARALETELAAQGRPPLEYLDYGGGLGVAYRAQDRPPSVDAYARVLARAHRRASAGRRSHTPLKLGVEPGRWITANAGVLLTRVVATKHRGRVRFVVVDAGMNDLIRPSLYDSHHEVFELSPPANRSLTRSDVVGPVCESADFFAKGRRLSAALAPGDALAVLSAGAYGFAMSSQYNSRPRVAEILVDGAAHTLIRARESYEDLVRGES